MREEVSQYFELESKLRGELVEFVRLCEALGFDTKDRIVDLLLDAGVEI